MTKEDMEMTAKEKKEKEKSGIDTAEWVTCRFAERMDGTKGIIPEILQDLLTARKKIQKTYGSRKRSVYEKYFGRFTVSLQSNS